LPPRSCGGCSQLPATWANPILSPAAVRSRGSRLPPELAPGDLEARNRLLGYNLRLVAHVVKPRYDARPEEPEELLSTGTMGPIKASNGFRPDNDTRLAAYAARCPENEILMHFRSLRKRKGEKYLHDPIGAGREGNERLSSISCGSMPVTCPRRSISGWKWTAGWKAYAGSRRENVPSWCGGTSWGPL